MIIPLHVFNDMKKDFNLNLSEEIIDYITDLTIKVSAPNYIKTPTFSQDKYNKQRDDNKKRKKHMNLSNKNSQITFKLTEKKETSSYDKNIDTLRSYLNRITDKTYNNLLPKINEELDMIFTNALSDDEILKIHYTIFNVIAHNKIYSKLYTTLYINIINKFDALNKTFWDKIPEIRELFRHFYYVDSAVNYDKFCKMNKENEYRRNVALLLINLYKQGFINITIINDLITELITYVLNTIREINKENDVNEMCQLLSILYITDVYNQNLIIDTDNNIYLNETIITLSNEKNKRFPSLQNKSIFVLMDIKEKIMI